MEDWGQAQKAHDVVEAAWVLEPRCSLLSPGVYSCVGFGAEQQCRAHAYASRASAEAAGWSIVEGAAMTQGISQDDSAQGFWRFVGYARTPKRLPG